MIQFLTANWLWIAVLVFFVAMHLGGHGCGLHRRHGDHQRNGQQHGGHAGHQPGDQDRSAEPIDYDEEASARTNHGI